MRRSIRWLAAATIAAAAVGCGGERRGGSSGYPDGTARCGEALPPEPAATGFALRFDHPKSLYGFAVNNKMLIVNASGSARCQPSIPNRRRYYPCL